MPANPSIQTAPGAEPMLVRTNQAPAFVGVPRSTFFVIAKRDDFPRQVVLGPRATGYLRDELRAWVVAQRRNAKSRG